MKVFLGIALAYKRGEVSRTDLEQRETSAITRIFGQQREGHVKTPLELVDSRHPDVDIYSTLMDNEYLVSKICDGLHDPDLLARTVSDHKARTDGSLNPEWRNLWYMMQSSNEVVYESHQGFSEKFRKREYNDAGVILHSFGILLELRRIGLSSLSKLEVLAACKAYIDDMFANDTLPELNSDFLGGFRHGSAYGLGFMNAEEKVFQRAWAYYARKSAEKRSRRLLGSLQEIMTDLCGRELEFRKLVLQSDSDENSYSNPILHLLDPIIFSDKLLSCSGAVQFELLQALGARYSSNPYQNVLRTEAGWLRKVKARLLRELKKEDSLTQFRIRKLLEWNMPAQIKPKRKKRVEPNS